MWGDRVGGPETKCCDGGDERVVGERGLTIEEVAKYGFMGTRCNGGPGI